jgi:hypothetical protein
MSRLLDQPIRTSTILLQAKFILSDLFSHSDGADDPITKPV